VTPKFGKLLVDKPLQLLVLRPIDFHNIVVWGKLAEIAQQYVKKGRKIYVEGRMQTSDWQGEDGVKRYRTEIIAENFILLDRSGAPTGESFDRSQNTSAVKPQAAPAPKKEEVAIDDLPF
jgi:single-strand DNA-binding protein